MCYHTKQTQNLKELEKRYNAKINRSDRPLQMGRFSGFNYPKTPIISNHKSQEINHYQWGLIPSWSKNIKIQKYTLNAKIETLSEKPAFKMSLSQRCLVLVDGFYEWQWLDTKGRKKKQFEITEENGEPFAIAGIWNAWLDPKHKTTLHTYSIITTKANSLMSQIHNIKKRMPVVLSRDHEKEWLEGRFHMDFEVPQLKLKARSLETQLSLF